jgi:hypothetical protein
MAAGRGKTKQQGQGAKQPRRGRKAVPRARKKSSRRRGGPWKRAWRGFRSGPAPVQWVFATVCLLALAVAVNFGVQVARKPSELFFPVSNALNRTPAETWRSYGHLFEKHSTARVSPTFLAALAQVEASGNPIVRTYWRWSWSVNPFDIYRPASSAVGLYQLIDGTYDEARRLCVHDHVVVEAGAWNEPRSCWFNGLYTRTVPSHAIEMTSAYLDRQISNILARHRVRNIDAQRLQHLAAVIHLCGAGAGSAYARRGFRFGADGTCGDHSARAYLARVDAMKRRFDALAAG